MSPILSSISILFIPSILTAILLYGACKKVPLYDLFIKGVRSGLETAAGILPFLIAIFFAIEAIVSSGAMRFLEKILAPFFHLLGIPPELISLILLRPVSGSGSLVLVENIMKETGADSFIGRAAGVMVGSCETVFYVLALYFGVTAVKKMRHAFPAGIIGYVAGIFASLWICRLI